MPLASSCLKASGRATGVRRRVLVGITEGCLTLHVELPLLFVDIDGVLNPYEGECPDGFVEHWLFPEDDEPVRVCATHGEWLHELATVYELVWGSSWTATERALIATVLDLPEFHGAVDLPLGQSDPALKVPAVDLVAGDRPLAWIDDLLTLDAWAWATARAAPTLLIAVDPSIGLTRPQVDELAAWATGDG